MKFKKKILKEFNAQLLKADMHVRYWEDAEVNGIPESDDDPKIPCRDGDMWRLRINVDTGQIINWPKDGPYAKVEYKVCDGGIYSLYDEDGELISRVENGYVPAFLATNGEGYGDYVILEIDGNGFIKNWKPYLSYFEDPDDE